MATLRKRKADASANDLEILYPERSVLVGGRLIKVREYSFLEGMRLAAAFSAQVQELKAALAGEAAGNDHSPAIIHLLTLATGEDVMAVGGCSDAEYGALVRTWLEVNGHLFEPLPEADSKKKADSKAALSWGGIHAELIAAGHTIEAIAGYTLRQINLHFACAQRLNRRMRAAHVVDANLAFAGGKSANEHIKKLQGST
jgi:hypothetical protein